MKILQVLDDAGRVVDKAKVPKVPQEKLLRIYEAMLATRIMNERGFRLQRQGRIGFYIGAEGQEAAHVAFGAALRDTDWYFPHYRDLGVAYYRGAGIRAMMHQIFGTARDATKGRQMPNHFTFRDNAFSSISSPLSTQIPQAVGYAYAARYKGKDMVVGTSFGEGSTSEGDFHVALNAAGVWKAPVVFLCQNNQWAISVPVRLQTASDGFAVKAVAYGFEGVRVDGNDALAVYAASDAAVQKARAGGGPTLIEAVTYRLGPHSSSDDPTRYVPLEELEAWRRREPIPRFKAYLLGEKFLTESEDKAMIDRINEEITAAIAEVEKAGPPPLESIVEDVFAKVPWHLQEQLEDLKRFGGEP